LPGLLNVAAPRPVRMEALVRAADCILNWRNAPTTAIQEVTLDATRLTRLLPGISFCGSADAMIADWQSLEVLP